MNRTCFSRILAITLTFTSSVMLVSFDRVFAASLALSDTPLVVSSSVQPNVMLLIDTSGSMDNIIWADGYDDTIDYPDWSNGYWSGSDGNVFISDVPRGNCSNGWGQGKRGTPPNA